MVSPRGFALIEVVVALTLLGVALLGVTGSTVLAARVLRQAEATERSALEALQIIDSLSQVRTASAGERRIGRLHVTWQVDRDTAGLVLLEVAVAYPDGSALRTANYRLAHPAVQ